MKSLLKRLRKRLGRLRNRLLGRRPAAALPEIPRAPVDVRPVELLTLSHRPAMDAVQRAQALGVGLDAVQRLSDWAQVHRSMRTSSPSERYSEFFERGRRAGLQTVEQLVPLLEVPSAPSAAEVWAGASGDPAAARRLLARVPAREWGYYMPLAPGMGTLGDTDRLGVPQQQSRQRSLYRLNFIMGGLSALCGGTLAGRSVLDMACNWGAFALEAALRGSADVEGFDIRPQNVQRARLLGSYFGVPQVRFDRGDVFRRDPGRRFDIVLNLGLMYHVSQPFELMKRTFDACDEMAVIDTIVHRWPFSGFVLGTGEHAPDHAASAVGCELHPTYRALIDLAYMVGFKEVVELKGLPPDDWAEFPSDPYGSGLRRCIVAFK